MGRLLAPFALAVFAATGWTAPAAAQDVSAPCRLCSTDTVSHDGTPKTPVTLSVETSLDFDRIILAGQGFGSAELRPDGSTTATGAIASIGNRAMVGRVTIKGEPGRYLRISLPPSIDLYGISGGTIRVDSIESDLSSMPKLDSNGNLSFQFGGVLRVSGDVDGQFRGDITIDVEYF